MALTVESFVKGAAKRAAEEIEVEQTDDGQSVKFVLSFRYGRKSEPFELRGSTDRERLRDLGVHVERFMGSR